MTNKDGASKQDLPQPSFRLTWRDGTYRVSRPNVGETDCYTADQMREYGRLCAATPASPAVVAPVRAVEQQPATSESERWIAEAKLTLDRLGAFLQTIGAPHAVDWREWIDNAEKHVLATPAQATQGGAEPAAAEPLIYLSSQQLPLLGTAQAMYYIPYRVKPDGNFDTPLYLAAPAQAATVPLPLELSAEDIRAIRNSVEGPKGFTEGVIRKAFEWGVETARSQPQAAVVPEAVERDAARYRYLRDRKRFLAAGMEPHIGIDDDGKHANQWALCEVEADTIIDAAIDRLAAKPTGKEQSS